MNKNVELLNHIYQNSQMGILTTEKLIEIAQDFDFKNQLSAQHNEYMTIHKTAKEMLHKNGFDEKGINGFEKIKTYLMINFQTFADKSVSHLAEMMIIGSNMGVIESIKKLKEYKNAETEILDLLQKLKTIEENNISTLKYYL